MKMKVFTKTLKKSLLLCLFVSLNLVGYSQVNYLSTKKLAGELNKLIEINNKIPNYINLSGPEFDNIFEHASIKQLIRITTPYLGKQISNAHGVCFHLLANALLKKATSLKDTQSIVEIFCSYYFNSSQMHHLNNLSFLSEKDFNSKAKKKALKLLDSLHVYPISFQFMAMAQLKKGVPALWNYFDANIQGDTFSKNKLIALASLARLDDDRAANLLINHYNSIKNQVDYKQVLIAEFLSFSLNQQVLNCLLADYKNTDRTKTFRDGDTGYNPAIYLAFAIASMLKNFPYKIDRDSVSEKYLFDFLTTNTNPEIDDPHE